MSNTKTDYPATFVVHCPSAPTNACDEHAHAVESVMRFMGAPPYERQRQKARSATTA